MHKIGPVHVKNKLYGGFVKETSAILKQFPQPWGAMVLYFMHVWYEWKGVRGADGNFSFGTILFPPPLFT